MTKNKILWSLFSTMLITNSHAVDAAPPPALVEGVVTQPGVKLINSAEGQAVALVKKDDFEQAIMLLEPYIKNNTGTAVMQETYVRAIFKIGTYDLAIEEAKRMWPKQEKMPVTMQKIIAESFLRLGKNGEALTSFRKLAELRPQDVEVKGNLAYTLVYSGQTFEGLGVYDQLLRNNPEMAGMFIEDAVALLSQGNILGGRSLFENIISLYPEKVEYRQRYAEALSMYNIERPAKAQYKQLAKDQNVLPIEERRQRHEKAIELARDQQFAEALATLDWLHETEPANQSITFDYVTVLHWSGNEKAAIKLYEQLPDAQIPDYVRQNMVDAYDKSGNYNKALIALRSLSNKETRKNKLREAEILMRLDERFSAQVIYDELLSLDPKDVEVFQSRAILAVAMEDYRQGVWNLEQALVFIPQIPENKLRIRQITADLAAGYINLRQSSRAIPLLSPYVNNKTASNSMQGNYILALKEMGKYKLVTMEAQRLWPDYKAAPLFALRAVAESYIQLKDLSGAIALYQQMILLAPNDVAGLSSLAFNLMLEGNLIQGLEAYNQLIMKYPDQAPLVVRDGTSLLSAEKYVLGKSLFEVVIKQFPSEALYRRQYADVLARNNLYQSAYNQYESISSTPTFQVVGLTGMVRMALALEDYKKAKILLETLQKNYGRSKAVAAVATQYDEHRQGRYDEYFSFNNSYKNTQTRAWNATAEQYIKGNYWLLAGVGSTHLDDYGNGAYQVTNNRNIGVRYNDLYQKTELWYDKNNNGTSFDAFRLSSEQHITDQLGVKVEISRLPVADAQAFNPVDGSPILSKNYGMTISKRLSNRENFDIGFHRSLYNDGNQSSGYSLNHNYTLYTKRDDALTRNLYWNRTWFAVQDLVYESPELRESLGAGWTLKRNLVQGYWQGKIVANWDRDYPESLAFNPYARLEYNHDFSSHHSLRLGAEYGLRTNSVLGKGGFKYSYRQLDALYTITW